MEYSYSSRPEKYAAMARELFGANGNDINQLAKASVEGMISFLKSVKIYLKLSDVGITDDSKFESMAEDTLRIYSADGKSLNNPKPLFKDDIIKIYQMSL
jgi:alcohol dehydrogenase